jgi:hypothetical protein
VKPSGATPTGERLDQILKPRLRVLEEARIEPDGTPSDKESGEEIKRCNFIVITDGEASKFGPFIHYYLLTLQPSRQSQVCYPRRRESTQGDAKSLYDTGAPLASLRNVL